MRKDFLIGIVATVLAMGLYYYFDRAGTLPVKNDDEQNETELEKIQENSAAGSLVGSSDGTVAKPMGISAGEPAKPEENQMVHKIQ